MWRLGNSPTHEQAYGKSQANSADNDTNLVKYKTVYSHSRCRYERIDQSELRTKIKSPTSTDAVLKPTKSATSHHNGERLILRSHDEASSAAGGTKLHPENSSMFPLLLVGAAC